LERVFRLVAAFSVTGERLFAAVTVLGVCGEGLGSFYGIVGVGGEFEVVKAVDRFGVVFVSGGAGGGTAAVASECVVDDVPEGAVGYEIVAVVCGGFAVLAEVVLGAVFALVVGVVLERVESADSTRSVVGEVSVVVDSKFGVSAGAFGGEREGFGITE